MELDAGRVFVTVCVLGEDNEEILAVVLEELCVGVDERGELDEVACAELLVRALVDDAGFILD